MSDFSIKPNSDYNESRRAVIIRRFRRKISENQRLVNWYNRFYSFIEFKSKEYSQKISYQYYGKYMLVAILFYLYLSDTFRIRLEFGNNINSNEMVKMSATSTLSHQADTSLTGWTTIPGPSQNFEQIFLIHQDDTEDIREKKQYIKRFHKVARDEMKKFGIPASIKMAQALHESAAGNSRLAVKNNNHFGIKCFSRNCIAGHCSNFHDDHHKDFFRIYKTAWDSWRAHSRFLSSDRYNHLKKHGKDYQKWAKGLKKAGYATDPNYPQKLINIIVRTAMHHHP